MVQTFPERVFALLVGIDEYQDTNVSRLQGCVKDCKDMESWLREAFKDASIETLYNEEATKTKIEEKIKSFASNLRIRKDEPIFIYFAGHGTEVEPLNDWQLPGNKRNIQMRIPYDFIKSHKPDQSREYGQGLRDRELSKMIAEVASWKGDNIVIIFDSCSSASGTRDDGCLARGITLPSEYAHTAGLEKSIFIDEYGTDLARASSTTPTNHVLLAACREDGFAYETADHRGAFTAALTQRLRAPGSALMTYDELILSIDSAKLTPNSKAFPQYPHCDSLQKDRFIFTTDTKDSNFQLLRSRPGDPQGGSSYYLWLGLNHNIRQDAQVLIFNDYKISQGTYVDGSTLRRVDGFRSELEHPSPKEKMLAVLGIPKPVIDIFINNATIRGELNQVKWLPHLGVNVVEDSSAPLQFIFKDSGPFELKFLSKEQPQLQSISCSSRSPASDPFSVPSKLPDILTSTSNPEITGTPGPSLSGSSNSGGVTQAVPTAKIDLMGLLSSVLKFGLPARDFVPENPDDISEEIVEFLLPRLQQIGHFYHHLNDEAGGRSTEVEISCVELEGSMKTKYAEKSTLELCEKGHLHIQAGDRQKKYGLKITNNSAKPIYFSLFYFSNSHFRIDALYNPPTVSNGKATFCLTKGEYKTIGYGTPGDKAWQFCLNNSQDADIGHLKLYWSHSHLDLLHLKRPKISWSAENRTDKPLGRDFVPEDDEGANDSINQQPKDGSQSVDPGREPIRTQKIAMFQFRTLPEGPCEYN